MDNYTPLTQGQTPTLGTSGDAVKNLQSNYNTNNPTATPLKVDGLYGPVTNTALNPQKSSLIVNSNSAKIQGMKDSSDLSNILNKYGLNNNQNTTAAKDDNTPVNDAYTSMLDKISGNSDLATQRLISEIKATKQNQENKLDKDYESYKGGLQLLGIQHNEATFSPDLLSSHIQQATSEHEQKLNDLNRQETKALMDAKDAQDKGNLSLLKDRMDYIKQIKTDQKNELKNYYDTISQEDKASGILGAQLFDTVNEATQGLNPEDHDKFIVALAQKLNVSPTSLVKGLADEKAKRDKTELTTKNAQATLNKKLKPATGATGMSKAQISLGEQKLKDSRGADGYVDPNTYQQAYNDWKGTTKQFTTAYPPKDYVNPKNKNLPPYLMPPKTKSTSTDRSTGL